VIRVDDDQGVWLLEVAGDLRQELVRRRAVRRDQPDLSQNLPLDPPADVRGRPEQPLYARHVEERLVERERFDQRRVPLGRTPGRRAN